MMMYKTISGLVNTRPREGTLNPAPDPPEDNREKMMAPHIQTDAFWHSFFPSAIRILDVVSSTVLSSDSPDSLKRCVENRVSLLPQWLLLFVPPSFPPPTPRPRLLWMFCSKCWLYHTTTTTSNNCIHDYNDEALEEGGGAGEEETNMSVE